MLHKVLAAPIMANAGDVDESGNTCSLTYNLFTSASTRLRCHSV